MNDKIKQLLIQFENVKDIDDLKLKFSILCYLLVEYYSLDLCLTVFHESNPLIDTFLVTYPNSYCADEEEAINGIENELLARKNNVNIFPIVYRFKKIGVLMLIRETEAIVDEKDITNLRLIAAKCAEAIGKLVVVKSRVLTKEVIGKILIYKRTSALSEDRKNEIIFDLLTGIFVPTRLYIAYKIDDYSYLFNHFLAENGAISNRRNGIFKKELFDIKICEIKRDKPEIMEIPIKVGSETKGILLVSHEQMGSVFQEKIKKVLLVLSSILASLLVVN